ncbi:hypothetical protein CLOSTASPAR_02842 [[Clostridium] asparagiforme DSM 15981]|uniref:Uncharacterized protein n=1 Tax=[Clostridium] asparagiforme DSM 15981 TaxID=518636 RepID=C0D0Q5_9FIRM|nr:hypothetical protein CLOSTASPAR_02842 [[Clostridium] asparagiforme DSM 15981]
MPEKYKAFYIIESPGRIVNHFPGRKKKFFGFLRGLQENYCLFFCTFFKI